MLTFQKYVKAESLEEAYTLNQAKRNKIVGGMLWSRLGKPNYNTIIDISGLGLDKIEESETEYKIGALVPLRSLELNTSLNDYTSGAVRDALKDIVGVQFRNMATVGGSIWGRFGFSDVLTVLLSLDSYVELYKGGIIPLKDFALMKYDNDILTHIIIKKTPVKCVYGAVRIQRTDFPVLTCAICCLDGKYQAAIGARPGRAILYTDETGLLKDGITADSAKAFAESLKEKVHTGSNSRGSSTYRSHLVCVLTERNLLKLGGLA